MRKFILISIFISLCLLQAKKGFSQNVDTVALHCSTTFESQDTVYWPHFGVPGLLDSMLQITFPYRDSIIANRTIIHPNSSDPNQFPYEVPLRVWIYADDNGNNQAITLQMVDNIVADINNRFANTVSGIRFYLKCDPEIINSTEHNRIENDNAFFNAINSRHDPRAINIHVSNWIEAGFGGKARWPWNPNNFRFLVGNNITTVPITLDNFPPTWAATWAHEIGHCLGVSHTHASARSFQSYNGAVGNCYQEPVSRTRTQNWPCYRSGAVKCNFDGDALCDTPAQPNAPGFRQNRSLDNNCNDIHGGTDNWGDPWVVNNIRNIMSYISNSGNCRTVFSPGQIAIMHVMIEKYMGLNDVFTGLCGGDLMATGPYCGGRAWFNMRDLFLTGDVWAGEIDDIYSPRNIITPIINNNHILHAQSEVLLVARESIDMKDGFHAKSNSIFEAKIDPNFNCIFLDEPSGSTGIAKLGLNVNDKHERMREIMESMKPHYYPNGQYSLKNLEHKIYPIPAKSDVVFEFNRQVPASKLTLRLYNIHGDLVNQENYHISEGNMLNVKLDHLNESFIIYELIIEENGYIGRGKIVFE